MTGRAHLAAISSAARSIAARLEAEPHGAGVRLVQQAGRHRLEGYGTAELSGRGGAAWRRLHLPAACEREPKRAKQPLDVSGRQPTPAGAERGGHDRGGPVEVEPGQLRRGIRRRGAAASVATAWARARAASSGVASIGTPGAPAGGGAGRSAPRKTASIGGPRDGESATDAIASATS